MKVSFQQIQKSVVYGGFPKMVVPPKTAQVLIIFGRKTHGFVGETQHFRRPPYRSHKMPMVFIGTVMPCNTKQMPSELEVWLHPHQAPPCLQ